MGVVVTRARSERASLPKRDILFGWPELLLLIGLLGLVLQLFPDVGARILAFIDVRTWTWRAYAVVCGIWVVSLVVLKAWRDNASNRN